MKIIVDDGILEVFCKDKEQALDYLETLRARGHKKFLLIKEKAHEQSKRQVSKDIQEPVERKPSGPFTGL